MKNKQDYVKVAFVGGGTGGHIYPGLAVADELRKICKNNNINLKVCWIGNSVGMDKSIVEKNIDQFGEKSADVFYGIPSGKLRRYFSIKNFFDLFKIFAGFIVSFFVLLKEKPKVLFSKGGFVSVPPCICAKLLQIPVYTHECDFTPGLATKINSKFVKNILISYEETASYFSKSIAQKTIVTGNPVRPVFYTADAKNGLEFLGVDKNSLTKPILLVLGGSLGAKQINDLVKENLDWLCSKFFVVHQTGEKNVDDAKVQNVSSEVELNYKAYPFIYSQMPDVIAASDVILSRAGANSIWECATLGKPMVLVPLCGSGTRGDQEDNASFFEKSGGAFVLARENATSEKLKECLDVMSDASKRQAFVQANYSLTKNINPAEKIANLIYNEFNI